MQDSHSPKNGKTCEAQLVHIATKHTLNGGLDFVPFSVRELSIYTTGAWCRIMVAFKSLSMSCQTLWSQLPAVEFTSYFGWNVHWKDWWPLKVSAWSLIHIKWYPEYCTWKYLHYPRALLWLITKAFYSFTVFTSMRPSRVERPLLWNGIIMVGNFTCQ